MRCDVALIGMGPVGAAAAIFFAHAGISVIAFDRDKEVYGLPRAVSMDGEVVRAFQRIGLGDEVDNLLQPFRESDVAGFANSRREMLFGRAFKPFGTNGWRDNAFFDQPEVDRYLRDKAASHDNVEVFLGYEVESIECNSDRVTLAARAIDGSEGKTVEARYLLGCDGAASFVRRTLDIGWHDLGYDHDWLVVDIVAKPGATLPLETMQVCDPDRLCTFVRTKDPYRRWEFKLLPGETREEMERPERIRELLDSWTPRETYDIRRAVVYQFHAATAETWRTDRIFLAGDAAHQTPPFLGQGMNAGMRDVINLAWKLPLVLDGIAEESLLDTYQSERDAHAQDLVDWAVAIGKLMESLAAAEAAQRAGEPVPAVDAQQRSSGYGQGRAVPPLRDGVVCLDQVSDDGATGYLFSQPRVTDASGREFLLDELLGPGFAIVGLSPADIELGESAQKILSRVSGRALSLEGLTLTQGHWDRVFDVAPAVIVRPDRYLYGHVEPGSVSLDDLLAGLARKLRLKDFE
ncbi:MAG: bifunctional 3-(3-hydroxy-phenyl)propionate/3-hydroxycinnamic acid hydroxylase [Gammaproteobacteria bacterium]|nr:bifunctional 3-(3-hydroxy-phenyl)propionate/3-hydroxycinnamic acid hydroxylase [Gammaproteobacteria bacterium]